MDFGQASLMTVMKRNFGQISVSYFLACPKSIKQRKNISSPLNDIRRALRNRVYHNEPVIFNPVALSKHYEKILQLLEWMDPELLNYNNGKDRFPSVLAKITSELDAL